MDSFSRGDQLGIEYIDNVQSFIEAIGNNIKPWILLIGREVIHFDGRRGKVSLPDKQGLEISVDLTTRVIDRFGCKEYIRRKSCNREQFISEFDKIDPPICYQKILELIQAEILQSEKRQAQRREAEKLEAEKLEAQRQEAQRQEVKRRTLLKSLKEQFHRNRSGGCACGAFLEK